MKYPNSSVPYGGDDDSVLRLKRLACSAVNHYPRSYDGSWCSGYGYVCGRCHMYADPWGAQKTEAVFKALGPDASQEEVAAACGGGPQGRPR